MNATDGDLLQRFVRDRSEAAFEELVRRHLGLVYSAALRQVNQNRQMAEDVTQVVFANLARKAARLARHGSIAGWLYTSTRFAASTARRSELRRINREQEAHAMQELHKSQPDAEWSEISPFLDEAMHALSEEDREAVVLRHFEQRTFGEIGSRLGISENAARMRTERALEKLHAVLIRKGIALSAAGLAGLLKINAAAAAPYSLVAGIVRAAQASVVSGGIAAISLFFSPWLVKMAAVVLVGVGPLVFSLLQRNPAEKESASAVSEATEFTSSLSSTETDSDEVKMLATRVEPDLVDRLEAPQMSQPDSDTNRFLSLVVLDASTLAPIPEASVQVLRDGDTPVTTDDRGRAFVRRPNPSRADFLFRIEVSRHGYVPKYVSWSKWQKDNIEDIPSEYTARLERAVTIGGIVVDESAMPISNVKLVFNGPSPAGVDDRERPTIMGNYHKEFTDEMGRWSCSHVPDELSQIYYELVHTNYITMTFRSDRATGWALGATVFSEAELRMSSAVFQLARGHLVAGYVYDWAGRPVAEAKVTCDRKWGDPLAVVETDQNGRFLFANAKRGQMMLTIQAEGFAPETKQIAVEQETKPVIVSLTPGHFLRGRVLNEDGDPIPRATVQVDRVDFQPETVKWVARTDERGGFEWASAPAEPLPYFVSAPNYFWRKEPALKADGKEKIITLKKWVDTRRFAVSGRVIDAATRTVVPNFRIEMREYSSDRSYSPIRRDFSNQDGSFRLLLEEKTVQFTIEVHASGYKTGVIPGKLAGGVNQTVNFELQR